MKKLTNKQREDVVKIIDVIVSLLQLELSKTSKDFLQFRYSLFSSLLIKYNQSAWRMYEFFCKRLKEVVNDI